VTLPGFFQACTISSIVAGTALAHYRVPGAVNLTCGVIHITVALLDRRWQYVLQSAAPARNERSGKPPVTR
jgi:hypothetical protein